jgi:hypothetical protein
MYSEGSKINLQQWQQRQRGVVAFCLDMERHFVVIEIWYRDTSLSPKRDIPTPSFRRVLSSRLAKRGEGPDLETWYENTSLSVMRT